LNRYRRRALKAAYDYCHALNRAHYENFPVASVVMPKSMRPAVSAVYAFSRIADDFADEAEFDGTRLKRLNEWQAHLDENEPTHPVFIALNDAMRTHHLPKPLFLDLIDAFKQDVVKTRYADFREVLEYCRRSANPVGRLVLTLAGHADEKLFSLSDAICTALQLANFWQDVAVDLKKDRIYLPQEDLRDYGVTEDDLNRGSATDAFKKLLDFQIRRTREFFLMGRDLGRLVPGRLGLELRLTWLTGMRILDKIAEAGFDPLANRPELTKIDFLKMFALALKRRTYDARHA
jgi:phytoene synthase